MCYYFEHNCLLRVYKNDFTNSRISRNHNEDVERDRDEGWGKGGIR